MNRSIYGKKAIEKARSRRGMTMAEILVTVAIVIILSAIAFISILQYQKLMAQRQRDEIAKELFIAAQNHLTMALSENTMKTAGNRMGTPQDDHYYFVVNGGNLLSNDSKEVIDYMLPFGSVDESVRTEDSYAICYDPKTGRVTDVFYSTMHGDPARFNYDITASSYIEDDLYSLRDEYDEETGEKTVDHKADRRKLGSDDSGIVGWYGGEGLEELGEVIAAPSLIIDNGERLIVRTKKDVSNAANTKIKLKLIMTGEKSHARTALNIDLNAGSTGKERQLPRDDQEYYPYVLDDITKSGWHFCDLRSVTKDKFIAGEDIKIQAIAYTNDYLANIGFSEPKETNSLYDSVYTNTSGTTAVINSVRHLENLEEDVSHTGYAENATSGSAKKDLKINFAKQTKDLDHDDLADVANKENGKMYVHSWKASLGKNENYWPVSCDEPIDYNGLNHSISNVTTSFPTDAGMFGTLASKTDASNNIIHVKIRNLELINFEVTSADANAGALAGTLTGAEITNVVAHNDDSRDLPSGAEEYSRTSIRATNDSSSGSAGGLIGSLEGGTVEYCAASLIVSGNTAGGLIGTVYETTSISGSYSGGHTDRGEYYEHDTQNKRTDALYNINATGTAGGFIGAAGSATISNCYSTCSVSGNDDNTGGFAGTSSGSISGCYSTGLVDGSFSKKNAFKGSGAGSVSDSFYYSIVNEKNEGGTYEYKEDAGASPFDNNDTLGKVFGSSLGYEPAAPYDSVLETWYNDKYGLRAVTDDDDYFVYKHFGDWPSAEIFVVNE